MAIKDLTHILSTMSLENIQTEITAIRTDIKNLAKIVRKIRSHQEDPDGKKDEGSSGQQRLQQEAGNYT